MRRILISLGCLCLLDFSERAWGQVVSGPPPLRPVARQQIEDRDQPATTIHPAEPPAAAAAPSYLEPGGGRPPAPWDSFEDPWTTPAAYPAANYLLVGPPDGVLQPEPETQTYVQQVTNPEDLFYYNDCNRPTIDLYRPDGMAPIGVTAANMLSAGGKAIVSYVYDRQEFGGNQVGTDRVSDESVLATFPIVATHMTRERHMFQMQFAPTDDLTLLGILPVLQTNMNFLDRTGATFNRYVADLGDVPLTAMYSLKRWDRQQIHVSLGVSVPLGVFMEQTVDLTPGMPDATYPLRTSSGTYDILPGLTYRGQTDWWTWGAQASGVVHTGRNKFNYRLGDSADLTAWLQRRLTDRVSASFRLDGQLSGNIQGFDARLDPSLVQTNQTGFQAYQRLNVLFGANYYIPGTMLPGQRLSIEAGLPAYQHLSGPQLRQQWLITAGWQLMF